jgi:hypothetical protein
VVGAEDHDLKATLAVVLADVIRVVLEHLPLPPQI